MVNYIALNHIAALLIFVTSIYFYFILSLNDNFLLEIWQMYAITRFGVINWFKFWKVIQILKKLYFILKGEFTFFLPFSVFYVRLFFYLFYSGAKFPDLGVRSPDFLTKNWPLRILPTFPTYSLLY